MKNNLSKFTTVFIFFMFSFQFSFNLIAQNSRWQWAKKIGGRNFEWGTSVTTDTAGNVIAAGWFESLSLTVGANKFSNPQESSDMVVVKYSKSGNVLWAKKAGGNEYDKANSVTSDDSGNVIVAGDFSSDSIVLESITLTNIDSGKKYKGKDIFIIKYDTSGKMLWAKSTGGNKSDETASVRTDAMGNIILAGFFDSPSITFGDITLTNPGMFIVKYAPNGNVIWAKNAGGNPNSVSVDASGNIVVTGFFYGPSISIGTFSLKNSTLPTSKDMFIAKYDSNGNGLWAQSVGGSETGDRNSTEATSVTTDKLGNVFITGTYTSPSISFGDITLTSSGQWDMFIVKYDSKGAILWAKNEGGSGADMSTSITTDASGNILVAGYFRSDTISIGKYTLINSDTTLNYYDMFIIKYDTGGNVLFATSPRNTGNERITSITTDVSDNIVITGFFEYGSLAFGATILTGAGGLDMFVAKMK